MYKSWWVNNILGFLLDTVRRFHSVRVGHGCPTLEAPALIVMARPVRLGTVFRVESQPQRSSRACRLVVAAAASPHHRLERHIANTWRQPPSQKAVNSIERDENYVPHLRSSYKLPPEERATTADYAEVFEETPLFTAVRMFVMQAM